MDSESKKSKSTFHKKSLSLSRNCWAEYALTLPPPLINSLEIYSGLWTKWKESSQRWLLSSQEQNQKQQQVHGKHTFFSLYFLVALLDILWNCLEDWRISSPRNSHCWSSACLWASSFMDVSVTVSMRPSTCDR
jgi:hypothetical protein